MNSTPRRRFLQTVSASSIVALAGCASLWNSDPSGGQPPEHDNLTTTSVHVADDVDLQLPADATQEDDPGDAELVILPGEPSAPSQDVVTWLTEDRVVALVGEGAQQSWLDVAQSDAYGEAYDQEGYAVGEPAPYVLVGVAIGDRTTTYRKSWGDQPGDDDILAALDETLADIESRRATETE